MLLERWNVCVRAPVLLSVVVIAMAAPALRAQVVINEVLASNRLTNSDEDGDSSDWLELYNAGASAVDLAGWALTDDGADLRKWVFPAARLAPRGHLLVWCSDKDRTSIPEERITETDSPLLFLPTLITLDDAWRYLPGMPEDVGPPAGWNSSAFDDSGWASGPAGLGFGRDEGIRTVLPEGMTAFFLRRTFTYQPGQDNLVLQIRFDDGFVAYLNGERVASFGFAAAEEPTFASESERTHSTRTLERFDLTPFLDLLVPGENVLAIAALNTGPTSSDLTVFPELGTVPPAFHTSFNLNADGETIALVEPGGAVEDLLFLPPQTRDHSWGRAPDGESELLYFRAPTPGTPNEGPASEQPLLVADTTFSVDRGFYDAPFEVEITTETEGTEIRYTLDGSEPDEENGLVYAAPIAISRTTVLRARAFKEGHDPTNTDTQTYIFLDDVLQQSAQSAIADGFPRTWGSVVGDYDMDRDVIGPGDRFGGIYAETIRDDLLSLPTLSIVLQVDDMFGPQGIYTNSQAGGVAWERPASVEYFEPASGREFQENCGLRIQGGYFRSPTATRKHSLRLLFKRDYGPTKLEFPLFGDDAVDRFDTLTLRAGANDGYSWDAARLTEQYTRDEFGRSLQIATGNAGAHGTFVHLYVNGLYWGLYNPVERPDHSFSAEYHGGEKEDWDAVHDLAATNGDMNAWNMTRQKAAAARTSLEGFLELQGRNPDGSRNPDLPWLLDVPNYADYLIVNVWGGNWDWPWKNWWAGRDRTEDSTGFKFYSWDFENTIGNNRSRSPLTMNALQNNFTQAGEFHVMLRSNPEYRMLFADRIHRLFFDGGVLTSASLIERYAEIAAWVEQAIVAESARWGDQHHNPPLTQREWRLERDWVLGTYLPERSAIVLDQFRAAGLYPSVTAPAFNAPGGVVPAGFQLLPRAPAGTVYYTTDGSDPRLLGGEVHPGALIADTGQEVPLVAEETDVRILVPADDGLGLAWTALEYDDSGWASGRTAVGYETSSAFEDLIATDLTAQMHEVRSSVYLRIPFDLEDPSGLVFLTLGMRYDDGFVAYLNGERVAARNAPEEAAWDSRATRAQSDRAAVEFEAIDLFAASSRLRTGRNVLAIHGLNSRESDSDFLIQPRLFAIDPRGAGLTLDASVRVRARTRVDDAWSALNDTIYLVDSNLPLRLTEVMYHPPAPPDGTPYDADEFEFIELQNIGGAPLDLSAIRLRGGIQFDFAGSTIEVLPPGAYVLVVENERAFGLRYGEEVAAVVAGEYSGKLGNAADAFVIEGYLGEPVLSFEYSDEWYPETDGAGHSLVIVDPLLPREAWSEAASWLPSAEVEGSPGADDASGGERGGWQRPGDANQDGRLNILDVLGLLRMLFPEEQPPPLPCDGVPGGAGGNRTLLDVNADTRIDLTDAVVILNHMFLEGEPPALGNDCVRIIGCPAACAP